MKNLLLGLFIGASLVAGLVFFKPSITKFISSANIISPIGKVLEKPLEKYTINVLSGRRFTGSDIIFDEATATESAYTVYTFHFMSDGPTSPGGLPGMRKKVTGVAHIPNDASKDNKKPVIVQFRGYVDREKYFPGEGTQRSAEVFARNGFISLAPDFLGYGGSDMPSSDIFEERFETYTTALSLLASVSTLSIADPGKVGIWGHSNGGHIALTVLEILHRPMPATLWAPVSKPFPYSILYYTDDADDHGKLLRKSLAAFEKDYDVEQYSLTRYLDRIVGPLQLHQGSLDEAVPQKWSDDLAKLLDGSVKDMKYYVYPGADHNMLGAWNTVVARDVDFFTSRLK
jgi:uncharacterized protein